MHCICHTRHHQSRRHGLFDFAECGIIALLANKIVRNFVLSFAPMESSGGSWVGRGVPRRLRADAPGI